MTPNSLINNSLHLHGPSPQISSKKHDATMTRESLIKDSPQRMIGKGFCGTVWAASEKGYAFKRENGGPDRSLKNDFRMHHQVLQAFQKFTMSSHTTNETTLNESPQIRLQKVPTCYDFIKATDQDWWSLNQQKFPSGYTPCNMIQSQRIPPFSETTRELLITNYCPSKIAQQIRTSEPNKDCLIRPYLGRRRTQKPHCMSQFSAFSLRNYPLHIDQMETLGMTSNSIQQYARTMAETLAIMRWIGEIDGNDIEFVLAPPNDSNWGGSSEKGDSVLGVHSLWVLDFDLCRSMTMDFNGVKQAVASFWDNDPYYPRPGRDPVIWDAFRGRYIQISDACMGPSGSQKPESRHTLPNQFIELVEQEGKRRDGKDDNGTCMKSDMY
jgi:hypothetical protein